METNIADGPLAGIRVVDVTSVVMGPYATHILADLGADVIKVESRDGDSFRWYHPVRNPGMSGSFLHLNRNKRSVMLDLKEHDGRTALDALIRTADVFVHSLRPQAIAKLGYDYEFVKSLKADIVYCGAYGFSVRGPYGNKAAYDDLIQACSGIAALHTRVGGKPAYVPTVLCDKVAGQVIATSILAALLHRERGGGGQAIEVPMFETMVEFAFIEHFLGFAFEPPLDEPGFKRVLNAHRAPFQTEDGYACILPYSDRNWQDFYDFTGRDDYRDDPRFQQLSERVKHIEVLYQLVQEEALKRSTAEWVAFCDRVSIPCMPVLALEDIPKDAHIKSVGLFENAQHPLEGAYRTIRHPVSFSAHPLRLRRHAPRLGEHTSEILTELGFKSECVR